MGLDVGEHVFISSCGGDAAGVVKALIKSVGEVGGYTGQVVGGYALAELGGVFGVFIYEKRRGDLKRIGTAQGEREAAQMLWESKGAALFE